MDKNNIMTPEEARDAAEVRDIITKLPARVKQEIAKGMAMFEAGYKSGYIDGMTETKTA